MKIINYLFSIYLIALSCLPCADMDAAVVVHSSKEITSNRDKHSHDTDNDTCSPFCVCNCCGNHSFVNHLAFCFFDNKKGIDIKLPEYKSLLASNFFGSIWQPPKIDDVV